VDVTGCNRQSFRGHLMSMTPKREETARRERFEDIFDANVGAVSAYALRRTTPGDADDVVAETFLVAWRRLGEVPREAKPWLLGVARRVLANQRRAAERRTALVERVAQERKLEPEPAQSSPILKALGRLSDADRELLCLHAWEELSTSEAAAVLGCSRAAAKVRLHRARGRLRTELERLQGSSLARATATKRLEECHDEK
jgi:RNA polymerase sigma-70 factor (ECF subfamily)